MSKRVAGLSITAQEEAVGETIGVTDPAYLNTVGGPDNQCCVQSDPISDPGEAKENTPWTE